MILNNLTMDLKVLEQQIIDTLKTVYDPEIPVDVYELGLIYEINITLEGHVHLVMTLTSPNCPAAESMPSEIESKVKALQNVMSFELELTFEPTWHQDLMSDEAKLELGFL